MPKSGISLFAELAAHFRTVVRKAAAYTVLATDEKIEINGTYTATLPVLSTMQGTTTSKKLYWCKNIGTTTNATFAAGSGNTIGGRASWVLHPGESLIIAAYNTATDWEILWPSPIPAGLRNIITLIATTSGTTAQNLVDSTGCPVVGEVVDIVATAQDTFAGNIVIKNATNTIATIAKSTTAGLPVGATTLTTPQMAVDDLLTVESDSTNGNARVRVYLSTQTITVNG